MKVLTDEGVHGVGEGTLNGSELAVAEAPWHSAELLVGMNPDRIEDIWHLMYHHAYWRRGPVQMAAMAAIDMAPWGVKGKVARLPVYHTVGRQGSRGVHGERACWRWDVRRDRGIRRPSDRVRANRFPRSVAERSDPFLPEVFSLL